MTDLFNAARGTFMFLIAQSVVWYQLNLQFINQWCADNKWAMALFGIPISYMYLYATEWTVKGFDGELWPGRLIGFATGMVAFAFLTWFHLNQAITLKTTVTLALATAIVVIQIIWK
jgi:hypothetical protein